MTTKPIHLDMHEQIECAQTLASRFYTDPAILEIEKSRIFQRTWQLVGTLHQPCVQQEDIGLCEHVQRGLRSSTYDRGRYSVKRENGVHHFHILLNEFLGRP